MSDKMFQKAVDKAIAEQNRIAIDEARAIAACDHSNATVEDRDTIYSADGTEPIGAVEFIDCPDCPLSDWFGVDPKREK